MRITTCATDYVIIRALTKSDWDQCNFALLHLTPDWDLVMSQRLLALQPFRGDLHFYCHTYWDSPLGYHICSHESDIGQLLLNLEEQHETWAFVELDDLDEPGRMQLPESDLDTHMLMINADSSAFYMCFGKHSSDEYSTEGFNLNVLLKQRQAL